MEWKPHLYPSLPGNKGNFIEVPSCSKPQHDSLFQRVNPKRLASLVSRSMTPPVLGASAMPGSLCAILPPGVPFPLPPCGHSSSCFDQWSDWTLTPPSPLFMSLGSPGLALYFAYSLSSPSTSPLGMTAGGQGLSLWVLLIFDYLSKEQHIALHIVHAFTHIVDGMEIHT